LKSVFANKEEASVKRDERRRRDKEEQTQSFADIQRKTLEVQQRKLNLTEVKERARTKELELKTTFRPFRTTKWVGPLEMS
jgi:hypothetical protein